MDDAVLLDTDVFSYFFKKHSKAALYEPHVAGKLKAISFITVGEGMAGAKLDGWGQAKMLRLRNAFRTVVIVPYDLEVCEAYASLADLKTANGSSRTLAANDRWIAACAIRHGIPLISHNRRHFEGVSGLKLITEAP
jgi:predicted nucleic acid-binding protein